jgi:hypothetical protein
MNSSCYEFIKYIGGRDDLAYEPPGDFCREKANNGGYRSGVLLFSDHTSCRQPDHIRRKRFL